MGDFRDLMGLNQVPDEIIPKFYLLLKCVRRINVLMI